MTEPNLPRAEATPSVIVIFGITGDLSRRKLLPALYHLIKEGLLHDKTRILGISRRNVTAEELMAHTEVCVLEDSKVCDPVALKRMNLILDMYQLDMDDGAAFDGLRQHLDKMEEEQGVCLNRLYYLSVPPDSYENLVAQLGDHGLQEGCQHKKGVSRLLIEKPFGYDYHSADRLVSHLTEKFAEEQIYRIDHYLAKETAQNILTFRSHNPLFDSLWNGGNITSIEVEASENIGIEGRAAFYEGTGALRDIIQSHLLQLLALVAMEPPHTVTSDAVHAARLELLQSVEPADPSTAKRGRYKGYTEEANNPDSTIETFASITVHLNTQRWHGVPVTLSTGKNLADKHTNVTLTFASTDHLQPNQFSFHLQPREGFSVGVQVKQPGYEDKLQTAEMDFSYQRSFETEPGHPDAYERVLVDAMRGDRTLFTTSEEVLAAWRIVQPVLDAWRGEGKDGLTEYDPGTPLESLV